MFFAIWIVSLALADAWICGNDGQCKCTTTGEVMCELLTSAPSFTESQRHGRRLTITAKQGHFFDIASLAETKGFDRVFVAGLNTEQCVECMDLYDFVTCKSVQPAGVTVTTTLIVGSHESVKGNAGSSGGSMLAAWVAIASIVGIIVVGCILVSLVNLHVRINAHSRSQDPPVFAVDCC